MTQKRTTYNPEMMMPEEEAQTERDTGRDGRPFNQTRSLVRSLVRNKSLIIIIRPAALTRPYPRKLI